MVLKCTTAPVILPEHGRSRPRPELPGNLNRPVEPDPARDLACQSRCTGTSESLNSGPRQCITLAYFILYSHPAIRHPQPIVCTNHWVLTSATILVVHFVIEVTLAARSRIASTPPWSVQSCARSVAEVARAGLPMECPGVAVARDSIALKTPTPSMGEAEGVRPVRVEMATYCAEHSTAIYTVEAARARTIFAFFLGKQL